MAQKRSIWARMFGIGKANANAALDALEDPKKMLDQTVRDYTNNIAQAEQAVAQTIGNLRMTEDDYAKLQQESTEWGSKAVAASNKADEYAAAGDANSQQKFNQLATVAIQRQMDAEKKATSLQSTIATQRDVVDKLKTGLNTMQAKRQELVAKRDELVARARNAKTQNQMMDTMKALDFNDPSSEISRFEQKIRQDEAKVRGAQELAASSLDAQFAQLEDLGAASEIDARLAALKSNNNPQDVIEQAPADPQLEAAAPDLSEVEARLAALKNKQA
ncbi:PspA/IM30 family protein [Glutamicibacter sp. M10]|uniref:PspA/IM30 family protein n=1 Tax=Glutamicibacter sp. M10 TaxID=3023076 RepID=UPI0021C5DB80|nr:PspA/IM30 family protein [Glutamicibacter sp. M10]UXN32782.1 PspA/IM30 family protein [Glutamicibacter sp. M10]